MKVAEPVANTRDTRTAQQASGEPIVLDGGPVVPAARISGGGGRSASAPDRTPHPPVSA